MASNKNRVALVGKIGCGKTTLRQKLSDEELHYRKTQTISYTEDFIDTPVNLSICLFSAAMR